jgi:hypothetical protein
MDKIDEALRKSVAATRGVTELRVADAFARAGYKTHAHQFYADADDGRVRDIALFATKGVLLAASSAPIYLMDLFHVEVRKTAAPWVVLSSARTDADQERPDPLVGDGLPARIVAPLNELARSSMLADLPRLGRSCQVEGVAEGAPSDPDDAMLACARASLGIKLAKPRTAWDDSGVLWCVNRLVVVDGPLCEAHLVDGGLELAAVDHMPVVINYATATFKPHVFIVHLVRHEQLGRFLDRHRAWLDRLGEQVKSGLLS